jgi:glycosyltransferase involved in cell wall biosynthesis
LEYAVGLDALPESPVLHLPEVDASAPEVTVLVPAMDEEITISRFVAWCLEGFERAGLDGEVLIIDSSTDATPVLALAAGARVLRVPRHGLGQAYKDAIPYVRGRFVVMGDADCTYDFREIGPFVDAMRDGAEFVIGSRFRGTIERGAMPLHHRYFGSPLTTAILDVLFATRFTDIHCGMRGMPLEALKGIRLQAEGWEYASEMIVSSVRSDLRIAEIPIPFYRDRDGRVSNVKRAGWTTP